MNQPKLAETKRRIRAMVLVTSFGILAIAGCSSSEVSKREQGARRSDQTKNESPWGDQTATAFDGRNDPLVVFKRIDELAYGSTTSLIDKRDRIASECMAQRGLDIAIGTPTPGRIPGTVETEPLTRKEFAAQFGFGLAAAYGPDGEIAPEVLNLTLGRDLSESDRADRNGIPTVRLDVAKSIAANNGDLASITSALFQDGEEPSCQNAANSQLDLLNSGPFYAANELRKQTRERIIADPTLADLQTDYTHCMAAHGFDELTGPTAAFTNIKTALFALAGQTDSQSVPSFSSLTAEMKQQLQELANRERSMAIANLRCEASYTPAATARSEKIQETVLKDNQALVSIIKQD